MEKQDFSLIRRTLGKTQSQMARMLCVSSKAIQSFEQGWRNVPTHIAREMLLLLSLKSSPGTVSACWDIKNCPDEWKKNCIVWELKIKSMCWYLNGTYCEGHTHNTWEEKMRSCKECKVYKDMFINT